MTNNNEGVELKWSVMDLMEDRCKLSIKKNVLYREGESELLRELELENDLFSIVRRMTWCRAGNEFKRLP